MNNRAVRTFRTIAIPLALALAILFAIPTVGTAAKKKPTKEEKQRIAIERLMAEISELRNQTPPNLFGAAEKFLVLFELFPHSEQGKMAAWEAYGLYRQIEDMTNATATLSRIMGVYKFNDAMANPLDPTMPVALRATARVELARTYAARGDTRTATQIARSVPNQYPGATVGRFAGEQTFYGRVDLICGLDAAKFANLSGEHNQAMILLLDLLRQYPTERIGTDRGLRNIDVAAIELGREAIVRMPASLVKRLALLQELDDASRSPLAGAKIELFRAEQSLEAYKSQIDPRRIEDAIERYKNIILKYPEVLDPRPDGDYLPAVEAVGLIRKVLIVQVREPKRAIAEMYALEKSNSANPTIAAHARYYAALVAYQNMHNYQQAEYDLELLLERYPNVPTYPAPKDSTNGPTLAETVKKLLPEIRAKKP
jgi:tetratricopeptide (TPR) repeat protein